MSDPVVVEAGEGMPEPLGAVARGDGVNVAVFSAHADAIDFCLFDADGEREVARFRLTGRTGDVFQGHVPGIGVGARYGLRVHGPYAPEAGHRFNAAKLLIDPHARQLDRAFTLHPAMFGYATDGGPDGADSAPFMPKCVVAGEMPAAPATEITSWDRTILYELHVRGFTRRHPDVPSRLQGTLAGLADPAAIAHLRRLGITTIELLPVAAWIDERHLGPLGLTNYWGYNPVAFMAPDPRLISGGWDEVRDTVAALADAGIETILDVVFNHSGEGDALGPTLSLRGLDNASYYRLRPQDPARYVDDSGTGNTLALDRAPVVRLVMDALRAWARAGVHGFRFDLATCLGRRATGFDPQAPLLAAIEQDPELRDLKLIAEAWDVGPGGYQVGRFGGAWGEWNDRFRDDVRRFWRGDPSALPGLATRLAGSADLFAAKRRPARGINFVTAHDGFTLADLVAFTSKHNAANGEDNRDGSNDNHSWNHGVEGATDDPAIRAARLRDQRALLATLLLARGTPMLSMGSELGQSQGGNNNAYAQDNERSWIDWAAADPDLAAFVSDLIAVRQDQPLLRDDHFLTGAGNPPDVEWLDASGRAMDDEAWQRGGGDMVAMLLARGRQRLVVLLNRGAAECRFALSEGVNEAWQVRIDSSLGEARADAAGALLPARSVVLLSRG